MGSDVGPTWHLRPGVEQALPDSIPQQLEGTRAPGGIIAHFYNADGHLLCQCTRGGQDWLMAFKSEELKALLLQGEQVIAVAYDGDSGQRLIVLELD